MPEKTLDLTGLTATEVGLIIAGVTIMMKVADDSDVILAAAKLLTKVQQQAETV